MRIPARAVLTLGLLVAGYAVSAADDAGADKARKEYALFEGTWKIVSLEVDGKKVPEKLFQGARLTLVGNRHSLTEGKVTYKGTYQVDLDKNPKQIDITFTEGPEKGKTILGIYELDGDTYRLCIAMAGKERPTEFVSNGARGHVLEVLRRDKGDKGAAAERKRLEGTWEAVSYERDGKKTPADDLKKVRLVIGADGKFTLQNDGKTFLAGTAAADPASKPNTIDLAFTEGPAEGKTALGIYKIDEDTLTLCRAEPGKDRPTEFTAKEGSKLALMVYRRVKD
jgi:uncharacterized protein (TIGR03067 family)